MRIIYLGIVSTMCLTNFILMAEDYFSPSKRQYKIYQNLYEELKNALEDDEIYAQEIRGPTGGVCLGMIDIQAIMYNKSMYTYEEGIDLYEKTLNKLWTLINQSRLVRPYLQMYPFRKGRISFVIEMLDASGKQLKYPLVSRIVAQGDVPKVICDTDNGIIILKKRDQQ